MFDRLQQDLDTQRCVLAAATRSLKAATASGDDCAALVAVAALRASTDVAERRLADACDLRERLLSLRDIARPAAFGKYRSMVELFLASSTVCAQDVTDARATLRDLDDLESTLSENLLEFGEP